MAEQNDAQEKTEQATQKRIDDSRSKGQVPRSRDLATLLIVCAGVICMYMLGGQVARGLSSMLVDKLAIEPSYLDVVLSSPNAILGIFTSEVLRGVWIITPMFFLLVPAAVLGSTLLGGFNFSSEALVPKLDRMDPIKGFGRMFGPKSALELGKSIVKVSALGLFAFAAFYALFETILSLNALETGQALAGMYHVLLYVLIPLLAGLALIAAIDAPIQLWNHAKQLRMSLREVRDEHKETEGSPELRQRVRQVQREMAQRRMMDAVPDADVIVTNPTHYAVAIRYQKDKDEAPVVVAKGADHVAARIRDVASKNGVPIVSAPPLARALHSRTEIGERIPQALYAVVARVLVYVYELDIGGSAVAPLPELSVPDDF